MRGVRRYCVYIMASRSLNLYTGIADGIYRHTLEHKSGASEGFSRQYNIHLLVYYETFRYVNNTITREKQGKAWTRAKRIASIKKTNPTWQDLAEGWGQKIELQTPRFARGNKFGNDQKAKATPLAAGLSNSESKD